MAREDGFRTLLDYRDLPGVGNVIERRLAVGKHSITDVDKNGTTTALTCLCGWRIEFLSAMPELGEWAAYLHITEPLLVIPESDDNVLTKDRRPIVHSGRVTHRRN